MKPTYVSLPDDLPVKLEQFMTNLTTDYFTGRSRPRCFCTHCRNNCSRNCNDVPRFRKLCNVLSQIYGTALGISVLCIVLGDSMISKDGFTGRLSFSQVLTLDAISETDDADRQNDHVTVTVAILFAAGQSPPNRVILRDGSRYGKTILTQLVSRLRRRMGNHWLG
jgi:hypothetical protein